MWTGLPTGKVCPLDLVTYFLLADLCILLIFVSSFVPIALVIAISKSFNTVIDRKFILTKSFPWNSRCKQGSMGGALRILMTSNPLNHLKYIIYEPYAQFEMFK